MGFEYSHCAKCDMETAHRDGVCVVCRPADEFNFHGLRTPSPSLLAEVATHLEIWGKVLVTGIAFSQHPGFAAYLLGQSIEGNKEVPLPTSSNPVQVADYERLRKSGTGVGGGEVPSPPGVRSAFVDLHDATDENRRLMDSLLGLVYPSLNDPESQVPAPVNLRDELMIVVQRIRRSNELLRSVIEHLGN